MGEYTDAGVGSDVLALSQLVRGGDPKDLVGSVLRSGSTSDAVDLFVLLFATRNTRGGKGEKKLAYGIFLRIYRDYPETALKMIELFPHYGYWKDLLQLIAVAKDCEHLTPCQLQALAERSAKLMSTQLQKDIAVAGEKCEQNGKSGPTISLLAKWLPRERSAFDKKTGVIDLICRNVWPYAAGIPENGDKNTSSRWESAAKRKYRKVVAELTSHLALPEVLLAAKREEEIQFQRVASRATMRLKRVFLNETEEGSIRSRDPKRIKLAERFIEHTLKHGAKGGQLMPHEIVARIMKAHKISRYEELLLDAMWKDMLTRVLAETAKMSEETGVGDEFSPTQMVPLSDVSGSMYGTPMEVSIALGILISEITHPAFRGMVLTFESNPRWHKIDVGSTIVEKVRSLQKAPWGGSTDFAKAYRLILETAELNKLEKEDMPALIVFSDMQFDFACGFYGYGAQPKRHPMETMHEHIRREYERVGKRLGWRDCDPDPIVFWNLRSTGGHPVDKDTEGAVLLSGFSPSLLKLVMYGEALKAEEVQVVEKDGTVVTKKIQVTPAEVLRKMLNDKLYDPVREVLGKSAEGKLAEYECLEAENNAGGEKDSSCGDNADNFELV